MYEPQVDDYVKWTTDLGMVHEGWVYFKCDYTPKKKGFPHSEHYITIELGVKDMPPEQQRTSLHKKNHVLLLCYHFQWHQLEYITNRRDNIDVQMYHSQEGRYADVHKTSMLIPFGEQRESLNFIEWSIEGLARSNFS